jgi:hypothetical protein
LTNASLNAKLIFWGDPDMNTIMTITGLISTWSFDIPIVRRDMKATPVFISTLG